MANPAASLPGTRTIVLPREPRRGLFGHLLAVLLQPVTFFRQMPTTRQWLGAALVILVLVGTAEVRRTALTAAADGGATPAVDVPFAPSAGDSLAPGVLPGSDLPLEPILPSGVIPGDTAANNSMTETTVTALIAASSIVLVWVLQAIVLIPVPMFNAAPPSIARNLQVAVWASVPMGLLALVQIVYYAVGGEVGEVGVAVLLERWSVYPTLPVFAQAVLHSLSLHLTLFWLWSLVLLYIGARRALGGRWWAASTIWIIWVAFVLLLPVLTGAIGPLEVTLSEQAAPNMGAMFGDVGISSDGAPPGLDTGRMGDVAVTLEPGAVSP